MAEELNRTHFETEEEAIAAYFSLRIRHETSYALVPEAVSWHWDQSANTAEEAVRTEPEEAQCC